MMIKYTFVLAFLAGIVFLAPAQKKGQCVIAFYNSENLYDTINDPDVDDEEFLPEGKNKWNGERFEKKLVNLSRVIDSLGGGPSILGFSEIENKYVLEALISTKRLAPKNYGIVHHNSPDKRGIDVALIYQKADFEPIYMKPLPVTMDNDPKFITRDIVLVKGNLHGKPLYIFLNHWPSRRGGEEESRPKRIAAAKVARMSVDSILKKDKNAAIVLMGDFNDEPTDVAIAETLAASADPKKGELYNTMAPLKAAGDGSYSYKEHWDMIDQMIISQGLVTGKSKLEWVENSTAVYRPVFMHDKYSKHSGAPYRTYAGPKFIGGYSDHFPVFGIIKY